MDKCRWAYNEDKNCYETNCGRQYCFAAGTPKENKYYYCPKCGRLIEVNE
jgi:hypothetical protein